MSVTHVASTGIATVSINEGATADVDYVGVAADRMGILMASLKEASITYAAVTGWTLLGSLAGGDPAHVAPTADNGLARIGVWYKRLVGSETSFITVSGSTATDSIRGVMSVYSSTSGLFEDPVFVSGNDATHGGGQSVVCGSWAESLLVDDIVLMAFANDTDNLADTTGTSITQTGATFGTITMRNRQSSSTGNDCGIYTFDVPVLTGSANAPTIAYTLANTRCGPGFAIRIREAIDEEPTPVSREFDIVWGTQARVPRSFDLEWDVFSRVSRSNNLRWGTQARVAKLTDVEYDLFERVTSPTQVLYDVQARVLREYDLFWDTFARVMRPIEIEWDVLIDVSRAFDARWDVYRRAMREYEVLWDVGGKITKDFELRWGTQAKISKQYILDWDVLIGVSRQCEIDWDVRARIAQTWDILWDTESGLGVIRIDASIGSDGPVTGSLGGDGPIVAQVPSGRV